MSLKTLWERFFGPRAVVYDQAVVDAVRVNSYQVGLAEGELRGRLALSRELEREFAVDGVLKDFTAEDAVRTRQRQVH